VPCRGNQSLFHGAFERSADDHRDVDVASPVHVAAQGGRAREVDAHELASELTADAHDELVEVLG
jgi:hypothetical protein